MRRWKRKIDHRKSDLTDDTRARYHRFFFRTSNASICWECGSWIDRGMRVRRGKHFREQKPSETHKAICEDPVRADITWRDFESLLKALGAKVVKGSGSVRRVYLNDEVGIFHEPHPQKVMKKWAVRYARVFLSNAGIDSSG
jgi:hypothetical protein